jgi:hypothetical protein
VNTKPSDEVVFDLVIDTDGSSEQATAGTVQLNPIYAPLSGSVDERIEYLSTVSDTIDGRWMLAAQHLECWRSLWTPHFSDHLPTLEQLLTWLVIVECKLEQN